LYLLRECRSVILCDAPDLTLEIRKFTLPAGETYASVFHLTQPTPGVKDATNRNLSRVQLPQIRVVRVVEPESPVAQFRERSNKAFEPLLERFVQRLNLSLVFYNFGTH
jgi:hypothetical protein